MRGGDAQPRPLPRVTARRHELHKFPGCNGDGVVVPSKTCRTVAGAVDGWGQGMGDRLTDDGAPHLTSPR